MGLKLWTHNYDCQIAVDSIFYYYVAFAAWHTSGSFYFKRGSNDWKLFQHGYTAKNVFKGGHFSILEDDSLQCSAKKFW